MSESNATAITPIGPIDENSSLNFNPTSSFESYVIEISPIDGSQLHDT